MTTDQTTALPAGAECLVDRATIQASMDALAQRLHQRLDGVDDLTVMAIMNGGLMATADLIRRLPQALRVDYVHATRYRDQLQGADLAWQRWPTRIEGTIVLVDDIFDEGYTMAAVRDRLLAEGAQAVITVVAAVKQHNRGLARDWVDEHAFVVPDRYVFGYGLDYHGLWRQLDAVWGLPA